MLRLLFLLLWLVPLLASAQTSTRDGRHWGLATINPYGNRFEIDYLSPAVHHWYGQRHLPETYMKPWYAGHTNYAAEPYGRYVNHLLEGSDFYDTFGSYLGRGWRVYNWDQEQPLPRGSRIDKGSTYRSWFDRLVIAGDRREGGNYRLMVGDEIYTFFTPLTFYKPRFNGVRLDYGNDRMLATLVASRPSAPQGEDRTDVTHLFGGHAEFSLGTRTTLGLTYINAHNVQTEREFNQGNPLRGTLSTQQNRALQKLWVRLRDDSPGKGEAPAILADFDIVLRDREGRELRGKEVGLLPKITGGGSDGGRFVASGNDDILLEYDLRRFQFEYLDDAGIPRTTTSAEITRATFELSVANDYRVEVASNLQTDGERFSPEIIFQPVRRAGGNVQDNSNTGFIRVDYGLPTANELIGTDLHITDWHGLSANGELVFNRRFFQYPNLLENSHFEHSIDATAAYAQAAWDLQPFALYAEGFSIADEYTTNYWLVDKEGRIRYKDPVPQLYEFVDDDDDYDATPEWQRPDLEIRGGNIVQRRLWNDQAWPGYDENGDFVNDFNQNRNNFPDYEEAFLRYRADRPQFLFGLDMNYNGTIDRFENDRLADYPYKGDHQGYNTHLSANAGPAIKLTAGRQQMQLISGDGHTRSHYGMLTLRHLFSGGSAFRFFAHGALVEDDISDDLWLWFQPIGSPDRMREVRDPLAFKNTWKSTLYADWDLRLGPQVRTSHRFKWDRIEQRETTTDVIGFDGRDISGFLGAINKAEWGLPVGLAVLEPRWKSEYRRDRPFSTRQPEAESLEETLFLLWTQPLFAETSGVSYFPRFGRQLFDSQLQLGLERSYFWMLDGRREDLEEDFTSWTLLMQLTNRVAYQGYELVTRLGLQMARRNFAESESESSSLFFLTINAGLGE